MSLIDLADIMAMRYHEQTIPIGGLYRGITIGAYEKARKEFYNAAKEISKNAARYSAIRDFLVEGTELDRVADERIKSMDSLK